MYYFLTQSLDLIYEDVLVFAINLKKLFKQQQRKNVPKEMWA